MSNDYGAEMNDKMDAPGVLVVEVEESLSETSTYAVWQAAVKEASTILDCKIEPWEKSR